MSVIIGILGVIFIVLIILKFKLDLNFDVIKSEYNMQEKHVILWYTIKGYERDYIYLFTLHD